MHSFYYWAGIINLLGTVQAFVFFLILIGQKKDNGGTFRLLAFICLSLGLVIAGAVLGALGYYKMAPHFIRIGDPFFLITPPLIYLYTRALCHQPRSKADFVHFIPFVVYVLALLPFYNQTGQAKIEAVDRLFQSTAANPQLIIVAVVRFIMMATYLFMSLQLIPAAEKQLKNRYSDMDAFGLQAWQHVLRMYLYLTGVTVVLFILFCVHAISFLQMNILSGLIASCMLYLVAYKRWKYREPDEQETQRFVTPPASSPTQAPREVVMHKYQASALSTEETEKYGKVVLAFLEEKKPYLEPDLTISDLATQLDIPPYVLSQVINRYFDQNFFDLVNGYRVKEMIRLMNEPSNQSYTLLSLAFEAGFNSKSTFNQVFKKHTGKTPSAYKRA